MSSLATRLSDLITAIGADFKALRYPRVVSITSSATPAINTDVVDLYKITALAVNITSMTSGLLGAPHDGQRLLVRIKDDGTSRTIAWGSFFSSSGTASLLTVTVPNKTHTVGFVYDSVKITWICVAVDVNGY